MPSRILQSAVLLVLASACTRTNDDVRRIEPMSFPVSNATAAASEVWHATYWDDWWTTVLVQRDEPAINFDWGQGGPVAGMDGDSFAARWEGDFHFYTTGDYRFTTSSDDGICLYVDDVEVNCLWDDHAPTERVTTYRVASGTHHVKVDYYENSGGAVAKASWAAADAIAACDVPPSTDPTDPNPPTQPDTSGSVLDGYSVRWRETFDGGKGDLSRAWGPGVDESVTGQLSMHSTPDNQDSGSMVPPTGREAGFGYGLYSFTLSGNGKIGAYALVWPSTDVWPGPELDIFEITEDGVPYGTVHWKADDGSNGYESVLYWGIDPREVHTYSLLWEPGVIRYLVDGVQMGDAIVEHVPADAAHGGENESPGVGMQTWWNSGGAGSDVTVYDVTYATHD
jgi:hypothetical protein